MGIGGFDERGKLILQLGQGERLCLDGLFKQKP
jgi:hypothetical protein